MSSNVVLVTSSYDHNIMFWEATTGQCMHTLNYCDNRYPPNQQFIVNKIDVSADKKLLGAACSRDARIYDIISLNQTPIYDTKKEFNNNVTSIGFQKDCKWFYCGSEDGQIKIFDYRTENSIRTYSNKEPINSIVMHPNEAELIAGDQQGNIKIYDLQNDKCRASINTSQDIGIRSLSIALNAQYFVAADSAGFCHVYELKNTEDLVPVQHLEAHNDYILKCLISPDVKKLATCSADKSIKIWNLQKVKDKEKEEYVLNKTLYGHSKWVWDCVFSCDTDFLISASSDLVAKIWKTDTGECIRTLKGHQQAVNCIALNDIELGDE